MPREPGGKPPMFRTRLGPTIQTRATSRAQTESASRCLAIRHCLVRLAWTTFTCFFRERISQRFRPGTRKSSAACRASARRVANSGVTDSVYFHRFNVSFSPSDMQREPTKGRSLDHLGFEVGSLDEFAKKLE